MLSTHLSRVKHCKSYSYFDSRHMVGRKVVHSRSNIDVKLQNIYERKTPIEHVLLRPGMYLGQIEVAQSHTWIYNHVNKAMEKKLLNYSPALLKIFDEIIVNAADNRHRDNSMTYINIDICHIDNCLAISVKNDGKGIPIEYHPTENLYIPELIFGHLLTGSNFDDKKHLMTGGRHGYGAKLTNIFSKWFQVEIFDSKKGLLYKQTWENNMSKKSEPEISKTDNLSSRKNDYTKISFRPDLEKFGIPFDKNNESNKFLDDLMLMLERRVYDVAGCVAPMVSVSMNSKQIPIQSFLDYVELFSKSVHADHLEEEIRKVSSPSDVSIDKIFYSDINKFWSIAVRKSIGDFESMSFVNSVWTSRGGTHVSLITNQLVKAIQNELKKHKVTSISSSMIKNKLMVFIRADIENPSFDSQTKETLTKKSDELADQCELSNKFLQTIVKTSGIVEELLESISSKERSDIIKTINKEASSNKRRNTVNVPKLEDAHVAGTSKAADCTLILTEGDSAKALAVAGFEVVGRQHYGVLPLRGKILNARDLSLSKVVQNKELISLIKSIGLNFDYDYTTAKELQSLRYGHVMIMCDQDQDGSHIKGLVINFIHRFWPWLLQAPGFLQQFITPLIKAKSWNKSTNKTSIQTFYSLPEYEDWLKSGGGGDGKHSVKYYKGLGTNTSEEGKEYFRKLNDHKKIFESVDWKQDSDSIDLAFSQSRVDDRRKWLNNVYDANSFIDPRKPSVSYKDFIDKELIHFSQADNMRSLPHVLDGLKPSQRKVLYGCFKRKLDQEMKVVQLAGYIAEHTAYHHGEASLHATIIRMAQNFVGSNNVPLLMPLGQFGTRAQGGDDHASPRYIFTKLSPIARYLYPEDDDVLLDYLQEDGQRVEPRFYVPILPTLLLNGSKGIGTGWSTDIPAYNIQHIIDYIIRVVRGERSFVQLKESPLMPWSRGFEGSIASNPSGNGFTCRGMVHVKNKGSIEITELPIGVWTEQYKEFLNRQCEEGVIKHFDEHHSSTHIKFVVQMTENSDSKHEIVKKLHLEKSIQMNNMNCFNSKGALQSYTSPEAIIEEHFPIRFDFYRQRKLYLSQRLSIDETITRNKYRFIHEILSGELNILKQGNKGSLSEASLTRLLEQKGFSSLPSINGIMKPVNNSNNQMNDHINAMIDDTNGIIQKNEMKPFSYLLEMPIHSLTEERLLSLQKQMASSQASLEALRKKSESDLWVTDLEAASKKAKELKLC